MRPVTFPTHSPYVLAELRRPAVRRRTLDGAGHLFEPFGPSATGVLPAVVVLPDLHGPRHGHELAYGEQLARRGYVVLAVDSFAPRGCAHLRANRRLLAVTEAMMLADAFAALRTLAGHPRVDPDRVAAVGFGYGGMVALMAAYRQLRDLCVPDGLRFGAHVSYYGWPALRLERGQTTGAPAMLLLGDGDEAVSIRRSRDVAGDLARGGSAVAVRVYPDAAHGWDGEEAEAWRPDLGLARLRLLVTEDHRTRDQWSGVELRGPVARRVALWLARGGAPCLVQRNTQVRASSDEDLARFLADTVGEPAALIRAGAAQPHAGSRSSQG